jgi:hypothetical protein
MKVTFTVNTMRALVKIEARLASLRVSFRITSSFPLHLESTPHIMGNRISVHTASLLHRSAMDEDAKNELRTGEVRKDEMQPLLNSTELKFQSSDYNIYRIHDDRNEQQEHNDDCPSSSDDDSNAPEETDAPQSSPAEAAASISPNAADARNKFDATRRATGNRVRLSVLQARDAVSDEVRRAKELGFIGIAKEIGRWMKAHPAETAAIIVFVVVMASTPAILAAMGFTTAGIAAGTLDDILCLSTVTDKP